MFRINFFGQDFSLRGNASEVCEAARQKKAEIEYKSGKDKNREVEDFARRNKKNVRFEQRNGNTIAHLEAIDGQAKQ